MDIGEPQRIIHSEPITEPVEVPAEPVTAPAVEPVPA